MRYLRVRNWKKFQHYKDRRPPWIKFHVSLLDDYDLTRLPVPAQLLYDRLLLVAANTENLIPADAEWISQSARLAKRLVLENLPVLIAGRFLEECERGASGAQADGDAQTETEPQGLSEISPGAVSQEKTTLALVEVSR